MKSHTMTPTPQLPDWITSLEIWIGKLIAIGVGIFTIWKSARFTARRVRDVWAIVNQFADSLESLHRLDRRLQAVEARQSAYFEVQGAAIWRADGLGRCVNANAAYLRLIGRSLAEMTGNGWQDSISADDAEEVVAAWRHSVEQKTQFSRKFRLVHSDGREIPVRVRALPIPDAQGEVEYVVSTTLEM